MIELSPNVDALFPALLKAQGEMRGVAKDSNNPHFKTRYASLENVIDAAKGPLQAAGLAFTQAPGALVDGAIEVTTMLMHASGQWLRSTLHVPLSKRDPQGVGSAITYGCRYALMATLGLPPVDDDGESAMDRSPQPSRPAAVTSGRQAHAATPPLSEAYKGFLRVMRMSKSKADLRDWWEENKVSIGEHLPEGESLLLVGERNTLGATLPEFTEQAA